MGRFAILIITVFIIIGCTAKESNVLPQKEIAQNQDGETMKLTSIAFNYGELIPKKYSCQGDDINPSLKWENVPNGTKSFALIMDDPDAPVGLWTHWLVKDIPADLNEISEDSVPGAEVVNTAGGEAYHGPCPPSGTHRYFFKLYALDVENLEAKNLKEFYQLAEKHKIEEAVLIGKYAKS